MLSNYTTATRLTSLPDPHEDRPAFGATGTSSPTGTIRRRVRGHRSRPRELAVAGGCGLH